VLVVDSETESIKLVRDAEETSSIVDIVTSGVEVGASLD
jgi:hypothetical protein